MDKTAFYNFAESVGLKYSENESLARHTTFKIGGPAEVFAEIADIEQLSRLAKFCADNGIDLLPMGKGSNILAPDSGIRGVAAHFGAGLSDIYLLDDTTIYCGAGAGLAKLCRFAADHALSGLEFAYGIPGSVGGAVFMNAGAYGGEIKDTLVYADHVDKNGVRGRFSGGELSMSYRHSAYSGGGYYITGAAFRLEKGDAEGITARMDELLAKRYDKQPMDVPSAGSTFKRPEGNFASALIDQCGLKGYSVGGAEVSEKHTGFIINKGDATCADVLALIADVQSIVFEMTGVSLEPEVRILGE